MKQLLQSLKDGRTSIVDVPAPHAASGQVLIRSTVSLISAGTERMMVEFGKGNLIRKARSQPDKVRQVFEKVQTDGIASTLDAVRFKLDQPIPLGYCNVGRVINSNTSRFTIGDRVVSNGKHAEIVAVPRNLCARIPDNVSDEEAAFTVIGAIGLQGIRLVQPTLGECVAVIGLGLIGLMCVQMLRAQGCRVLGIDLDPQRLEIAKSYGAEVINTKTGEDIILTAQSFSKNMGVDAVIITASTKSSEPVSQAARMCRKRGRIVLVGVVGLELNRADFYEKELTFQVSCSYGPGRYDPSYEEKGHDYPIGFVRWTEQRNFEAVLELMASGALDVKNLISHRFLIDDAAEALGLLTSGEPSLGILLSYCAQECKTQTPRSVSLGPPAIRRRGSIGFLGAGNYAGRVLIPAFKQAGAQMHTVVSGGGISAWYFGKKFKIAYAATDVESVLNNPDIDTVVIATRHDAHARQTLSALLSGKHVFCEKPLCLTLDDLDQIEREALKRPNQRLMVGFNRRFAPLTVKMKSLLDSVNVPRAIIITVNAGEIPSDHWTQDLSIGGGRIVGEACHFIDLARHLAGSSISGYRSMAMQRNQSAAVSADIAVITLEFANGSIATIHYLANGHKGFPKERVEVFAGGRILQLDNFRKLRGWGWPGFSSMKLWRQDKGAAQGVREFLHSIVADEKAPIDLSELIETSRIAIEISNEIL